MVILKKVYLSVIIDTDQLLTISEYAREVGESPQLITHHKIKLKAIRIKRYWFLPIESLKLWPPKPAKLGRPVTKTTDTGISKLPTT